MEDDEENKNPPKKIDPLSQAFGLEPMNNMLKNGKLLIPDPNDDYNFSRQNIIDLIEKGSQYLNLFGQVAMSAQEPRHIEVLTNLLNSLILANEKLLDLKMKDQNIKEKGDVAGEQIINNNLFVGSTDEIQNMLENLNKKNND